MDASRNDTVRAWCRASEARLPLDTINDVTLAFPQEIEGAPPSLQWFSDQLRSLLAVSAASGFNVGDVRRVAKGFSLEKALGRFDHSWDAALAAIANCIPVGTNLRPFEDPAWEAAIDIGRAIALQNLLPFQNARTIAVAAAGKRLQDRGYRLSVVNDKYQFADNEIERATEEIRSLFGQLGPIDTLANIFQLLKKLYPYDFGMYLPARQYGPGLGLREPSIPFGFAINLAASVSIPRTAPTNADAKWKSAISLMRDLVSAIDVEPYSGFAHIGVSTLHLEDALRELALFDHLFQLRQWRLPFTPRFLLDFFENDYVGTFQKELGWTPTDVANLSRAVEHFATQDPNLITTSALRQSGVSQSLLEKMLPFFSHDDGAVNHSYCSPLGARECNLMFKPLMRFGANHLLLPAAPLLGPAFYEATMAALRPLISSSKVDNLQGAGTERVIVSLFRRAGLEPSFAASKYDLGANGAGECDLVFESASDIVLVECKSKALTRGSMAGIQGDALLDFAAGTFAAQTQALRHERILRDLGAITFLNGSRLQWNNRHITRLSVTLLDHGSLLDRMTFRNLVAPLLAATFAPSPAYRKSRQVSDFNSVLDQLRDEVTKLAGLGIHVRNLPFNAASSCVGQLEVLLDGVKHLEHFRKRLSTPLTFMSLNPLFEYHNLRDKGVLQ